MAKWDLRMRGGFFEHVNGLSLSPMPELVEIVDYRISKKEYENRRETFDEFLRRAKNER